MAIVGSLGDKIVQVGQDAINKSRDFGDVSKLNTLISGEEKILKSNLELIGRLYVSKHESDCEPDFEEAVKAVKLSEQRIEEFKQRIYDIRGVIRCSCGAEVYANATFCNVCGARIIGKVRYGNPSLDSVKCNHCGNLCKIGSKFCVACGEELSSRENDDKSNSFAGDSLVQETGIRCKGCGTLMAEDKKFCTACGTRLIDGSSGNGSDDDSQETLLNKDRSPITEEDSGSNELENDKAEPISTPKPEYDICTHCGNQTLKSMRFCTSCGMRRDPNNGVKTVDEAEDQAEVKWINCSNCGKLLENTNAFCVACGTKLSILKHR